MHGTASPATKFYVRQCCGRGLHDRSLNTHPSLREDSLLANVAAQSLAEGQVDATPSMAKAASDLDQTQAEAHVVRESLC